MATGFLRLLPWANVAFKRAQRSAVVGKPAICLLWLSGRNPTSWLPTFENCCSRTWFTKAQVSQDAHCLEQEAQASREGKRKESGVSYSRRRIPNWAAYEPVQISRRFLTSVPGLEVLGWDQVRTCFVQQLCKGNCFPRATLGKEVFPRSEVAALLLRASVTKLAGLFIVSPQGYKRNLVDCLFDREGFGLANSPAQSVPGRLQV